MSILNENGVSIIFLQKEIENLRKKLDGKQRKNETTTAQQIILLKHLGILEKIMTLNITKKSKAYLLSILLNRNADNIEKILTTISSEKSEIMSKINLELVLSVFEKAGLEEQKKEIDHKLMEIERKG